MSDEKLVELIAKEVGPPESTRREAAETILAVLRYAGFQVFKTEDAKVIEVVADPKPGINQHGEPYQREPIIRSQVIEPGSRCLLNPGTYFLVSMEKGAE